jgi:deoxyribonuclease-4
VKLGAHESIAGSILKAFERADEHAGEAVQIFTTNGSRWDPHPRDPGETREFAAEARRRRQLGVPLLAHTSYLINLAAAPGTDVAVRSRRAFLQELERSEELGVQAVILHPGAHLGDGVEVGVERAAEVIREAIGITRGYRVRVLLELTAGQGTCLGHTFEELRALLDAIGQPKRTGVCFDTCHAYAAGYDLRRGYEGVWRDFDRVVGLQNLHAFHLNDAKKPLGSRVDRHQAIGAGTLGNGAFRRLVADPRFVGIPAVLELPPSVVAENLVKLRTWRRRLHTRLRS